MSADERVDVVDADDVVVATVTRAEMRRDRLRHRTTFVVVRSSTGSVLVHRRSDAKDLWPGRWDLAAGGVVMAGETYDDAAVRELAEELGVAGVALVPLGGVAYDDDDVSLIGQVYETVCDGPFRFADGEVVEARFVTLGELTGLLERVRFVPDSVALVLPRLA